jgi:hypothetical protein
MFSEINAVIWPHTGKKKEFSGTEGLLYIKRNERGVG